MSINLDNVKAIVHNNKNVVKIEDSHGIVWQKKDDWIEIWSGSKSITAPAPTGTSTSTTHELIVKPDYSALGIDLNLNYKVRVHFTFDNCSTSTSMGTASDLYYANNVNLGSTAPTSPVIADNINLQASQTKDAFTSYSGYVNRDSSNNYRQSRKVYIEYTLANGFRLGADVWQGRYGSWGTVSAGMTVTKIEVQPEA